MAARTRLDRAQTTSLRTPRVVEAAADPLREQVREEADDEKDRGQVEERSGVLLAERALELERDAGGERVARLEQRCLDLVAGANHLRDRDRLAERATQAEEC